MSKSKIRLTTKPQTFNDITRYAVFGHTGNQYVNHRPLSFYKNSYLYVWGSEDNPIAEETFEYWKTLTGATPEEAHNLHAPYNDEYYDILPESQVIYLIKITISDEKTEREYYAESIEHFENSRERTKEYYLIKPLMGGEILLRYDTIKEIVIKAV